MNYLSSEESGKIVSDYLGVGVVCKGKTKGGVSSFVLEFETTGGDKYYFKQGNKNYILQKELSQKLFEQGLVQPSIVLATDPDMLEKGVVGESVADIADRSRRLVVVEKFGEYLAKIHDNKIVGWGELVSINEARCGSYLEYYEYLLPKVDEGLLPIVKRVLENTKESCLNHADTCYVHTYVDREENFWGLIDFDDVLGAPNLYDLAEFHGGLDGDEEMWNRFMSGYAKTGVFVDTNSVEFLVNEYLVFLDSAVWYAKSGKPELEKNRQRDLLRMEGLVSKIKKLQ